MDCRPTKKTRLCSENEILQSLDEHYDDPPEGCVLCGQFSIQQPGARAEAVDLRSKTSSHISCEDKLLLCQNCGKSQCFNCCNMLCQLLHNMAANSSIHQDDQLSIMNNDWFLNVRQLLNFDTRSFSSTTINFGTCCHFSSKIPPKHELPSSLVMPQNCTKHIIEHVKNSWLHNSDQDEFIPNRVTAKQFSTVVKQGGVNNSCALDFLHQYHDEPIISKNENMLSTKRGKKARKKRGRQNREKSTFDGALHLIQFGGLIKSQADNRNMRTDILCLGGSKVDGTPDVWHSNLCLSIVRRLDECLGGKRLRKIPKECWRTPVCISAHSPENVSKRRTWVVQFVVVQQVVDTDAAAASQGRSSEDLEHLLTNWEFGVEDTPKSVDVVMIIGEFLPSEAINPKLLLLRYCAPMLKGSISNDTAEEMYNCFRQICGRSGFEIRRQCGSSGIVSSQSDRDLCTVLSQLHSAIPRKIWGCFIVRCKLRYVIFYKKTNTNTNNIEDWTQVWYSPPHDGGKFKMPMKIMELYPVIGEFSYLKMLATTIVAGTNEYRVQKGMKPLAPGAVKNELENIRLSRDAYSPSKGGNMLQFVHGFNCLNDFNMICHVVMSHRDYFPGGESFENKLLVINPRLKDGGRGGGVFKDDYCWALLDWIAKDKQK